MRDVIGEEVVDVEKRWEKGTPRGRIDTPRSRDVLYLTERDVT